MGPPLVYNLGEVLGCPSRPFLSSSSPSCLVHRRVGKGADISRKRYQDLLTHGM